MKSYVYARVSIVILLHVKIIKKKNYIYLGSLNGYEYYGRGYCVLKRIMRLKFIF